LHSNCPVICTKITGKRIKATEMWNEFKQPPHSFTNTFWLSSESFFERNDLLYGFQIQRKPRSGPPNSCISLFFFIYFYLIKKKIKKNSHGGYDTLSRHFPTTSNIVTWACPGFGLKINTEFFFLDKMLTGARMIYTYTV